MHEQDPRKLPVVERIARWIPGYGGYLDRGTRRSDDARLRDAIADRLAGVKPPLEAASRDCIDRGALAEIGVLDRLTRQVDRLADRLRHAGSGTDAFYTGAMLDARWAESLHASDFVLFEKADALAALVKGHPGPEWVKSMGTALDDLDEALDVRARCLQGIR